MFCCCVYLTDPFTVDNLATDYTQVSGAWSVTGGKLTTSSSNAVILANPTSGSNYHTHVVRVVMNTSGDVANVLAGYLDPSNYLFVELTQSASRVTARFFKRVAGVNAQILPTRFHYNALGIGVFPGQPIVVSLCAGPDNTAAMLDGIARMESDDALPLGPFCGVATGAVGSSIDFDNLTLTKHREDNLSCLFCGDCIACIKDNNSYQMQVEGPGDIVGGMCGSDCGNAAGTVICSKEYVVPGQQGCFYHGSVPVCSGQGGWLVQFLAPNTGGSSFGGSSSTYRLRVTLGAITNPTSVNIVWEKDYGSNPIDCLNLNLESIPWVGESGTGCTSSTHAPVFVSRV